MNQQTRRDFLIFGAATPLVAYAAPAAASSFFEGKILRFYVGIPPGGAYDLAPRILAAHIGKHIPGNPRVVVENMPGAGSLIMMNFLYNRAARDGTAIGFPMNTMLLEPTLKLVSGASGNAQFDLSRVAWIGTPGQDPAVAWIDGKSSIKSFEDLKAQGATFGSTGQGADSTLLANLSARLLGAKIKVVAGYKGVADYLTAFERGEIDGAVTTYAALMVARPDWIKSGRIRLLAQYGATRSKDLTDVPTAVELAESEEAKAMFRLYGIKFSAAYPVVMPPEVPAEQVKILRQAFAATMEDPEYKAQIEKLNLSGGMVSAEEIERLVQEAGGAPAELITRLRQVLDGK
jgi:tripartite-type tricarboxylate transporter receptor subunit TctC